MKHKFLLFGLLSFFLIGCGPDTKDTMASNNNENNDNSNITTVDLNLSNFERYISYNKYQGWTGVAGYSAYRGWLEFKGILSFAVYDVTITYHVASELYSIKLDASGGGKTDYFDRNIECGITKVSGNVTYRI